MILHPETYLIEGKYTLSIMEARLWTVPIHSQNIPRNWHCPISWQCARNLHIQRTPYNTYSHLICQHLGRNNTGSTNEWIKAKIIPPLLKIHLFKLLEFSEVTENKMA